MANFYQDNQTVNYQYNADTINFAAVQTEQDCLQMIQSLQAELDKAIKADAVKGEAAIDAETSLKKAALQAGQPKINKAKIVEYLKTSKELMGGAAVAEANRQLTESMSL